MRNGDFFRNRDDNYFDGVDECVDYRYLSAGWDDRGRSSHRDFIEDTEDDEYIALMKMNLHIDKREERI